MGPRLPIRGRVFIRTLGCPKNEADGAALERHLAQAGWIVVADPAEADAEIVNTCGFIEPTKIESIDSILESVARKVETPAGVKRVIATGCLAQRYGSELAAEIPDLDAVVGFNRPDLVLTALETRTTSGTPACWVEKPGTTYEETAPGWQFDADHPAPLSAYVKIGDGCDNACRFCAIPLIRGKLRSRLQTSIAGEVAALVAHGTREVVLVSQDTTSWGLDLGDSGDLADLLRLLDLTPGEFWIRLMYAHPAFLTERHIEAIAGLSKMIPYIDMPLQHASDRMLEIMNRHITKDATQAKIDRLRAACPDLTIRTTFITGHPGETAEDFAILRAFANENAFERMGVFCYSAEDSTPAARMPDQVPNEVARERAALLSTDYETWSTGQAHDRIGQVITCLLERRTATGAWEGRTVHDAPEIDGSVVVTDAESATPGLYDVMITDAIGVDLVGSLHWQPGGLPVGSRSREVSA